MKKYHLILITLFLSINLFAQDKSPIAKKVQEAKSTLNQEFELTENILVSNKSVSIHTNKLKDAKSANYFDYDKDISKRLLESPKSAIALQIPYEHEEGSHLTLDLIKVPDSFYDYIVTTSSGHKLNGRDIGGVHYRGIVRDKESSSLVALSIFEDEMMGIISISGKGTINIGKLGKKNQHIIYDDANFKSLEDESFCMTSSDGEQNPVLDNLYSNVLNGVSDNSEDNCLRMYFEVDYDMYVHFGNSTTNTVNFVTSIFNQVAILYMNESITMKISEIFVWDTPDTYSPGGAAGRDDFVAQRPTFNGDLAHLLSFLSGDSNPNNVSNAGGAANGFGGVCVTGNSNLSPHSHTRLFPDFEVFPTFSRQVKVITHEIGHNLGSRHTHACVWNGNDTAIDGCSGNTEGSCPLPPTLPANTGTIMSYCDRNIGIDFTLGFGPQPGNVIRNFVSSLTCLATCVDCPDNLNITDTYNNGDNEYLEAGDWITSTATVNAGADITHDAGNYVCLNPGFIADNGAVFLAHIGGCDNNENGDSGEFTEDSKADESNIGVTFKNYPNPFTGTTTIEFTLKNDSPVTLFISDATGRQIAALLTGEQQTTGTHQVTFDGNPYPGGMYYYTIQAGEYVGVQKMILVK